MGARATLPALLALSASVAIPSEAMAQAAQASPAVDHRWRLELGATASTPYVEDGNGVVVRPGPGVAAGVDRLLHARGRSTLAIGLLGALADLSVTSAGRKWSGGATSRIDLRATYERPIARGVAGSVGLGGTHLVAAEDVAPFRATGGSLTSWSLGAALSRHVRPGTPYELVLAGDVLRLPGQTNEDPLMTSGWAGRLRIAIRHGR